jgi:hypothetical protein
MNILKTFSIFFLFFLIIGCANTSPDINKKLKEAKIENKLIKKYQISKDALIKVNSGYIFTMPEANGFSIYKLNKNFDLDAKKTFNILFDVKKIKYINGKVYIIGYDQIKNKPAILITDENLKNYKLIHFANKYDIPNDFIVDKNLTAVLTTYKYSNPDIELYENNKIKIFKLPNKEEGKFIIKKDGGYYIIGTIQHPQEDLLILFIKNGKIAWSKIYDFGMEDAPTNANIQNGNIKIDVISQDYMGAEKHFSIIINKSGKIIKNKKGIEFKALPVRLRT